MRYRRLLPTALLAALLSSGLLCAAWVQFNREYVDTAAARMLISRKMKTPPILDGALDDPCWQFADHTKSAFVQWVSREPSAKQTVAYVCHDDANLYLAVVCEEPNLKAVRMLSHHPGGRKRWTTAGNGDCIEAFLELGGVGGTGQVFQFISNIHPEVAYDGLSPYVPFIGTGYWPKGALGRQHWTVEAAFPYSGLNADKTDKVDYRYEGPPRRGEMWGLRLLRNGPRSTNGEARMRSFWVHNPTISCHVPFPTGAIIFEGRNALRNGVFRAADPETREPAHWAREGSAELRAGKDIRCRVLCVETLAKGESVRYTQEFGVLPNERYQLRARLRKLSGKGEVALVLSRPQLRRVFSKQGQWQEVVTDFFADPDQRSSKLSLEVANGSVEVEIGGLRVEQQIYEPPQGATCLTGNSPRVDCNATPEFLKQVRYTYWKPGTEQEQFPIGKPDRGAKSGWISAGQGALTNSRGPVAPVCWTKPGSAVSPGPHEILFDLGRACTITSVELRPCGRLSDLAVHVTPDGSREPDSKQTSQAAEGIVSPLYGRLDKINRAGRYVRILFSSSGDGLYFVRIWGSVSAGP